MDRRKIDAELRRDYGALKNLRKYRGNPNSKYNPQTWYIFGIQPPSGGLHKVVDKFIGQFGDSYRLASAGEVHKDMVLYGYPVRPKFTEEMVSRAKVAGNLCRRKPSSGRGVQGTNTQRTGNE